MGQLDNLGLPPAPEDALKTREAGSWVVEKLKIINCYLRGFISASSRAGATYYVDGFAGPGVNLIKHSGQRIAGSPLIALEAGFSRALMLEMHKETRAALQERVSSHGDRAIVHEGDVNRDLPSLMAANLDPRQPLICLLDPEGSELEWRTVHEIAKFRQGRYKAEQLILLPTDTGFTRTLFLNRDLEEWAERDMLRIFGNDQWRQIYELRKEGHIDPDTARTRYVELYAQQLRDSAGYTYVLDRQIKTKDGRPLYFLIFATDHDAGQRIMDHCFDRVWPPEEGQLSLFIKEPRPRRLK